ncbi:unnamed protein product [Paramecium pentaurelia]|uniref:Polyadenylate-binding protein n=1 Tax=Paramecium pentaurelia TaxID=43138 RepID=A0A8S1VJ10_9CILI|nr:unnamed protein product [Paramecium pentaurelia]
MQKKKFKQQLLPKTTPQQSKTIILIENLDQCISEDYLYSKFKVVGEIQSLKITKDKITQKSKGQAFITYSHPDSAEEARKKFNNQIFIRNNIRVKPYIKNFVNERVNIFIDNLPNDADIFELEQEFNRFGTILLVNIHRDNLGKQLNYGYIQFEKKEDADNLMKRIMIYPIIFKGKQLKLKQFKVQTEQKVESNSIYLRNFAVPLQQKYQEQEKVVKAIEYGWFLIIKDYFIKNRIQVKNCVVKIDQNTRQPWTIITFETSEIAKINFNICEQLKTHPCINSSAHHALELINTHGPSVNNDGSENFSISEITQVFKEMAQVHNDTFKGQSENFFYNMVQKKYLNPEERLILVENIKYDVTKEQIQNFLSRFGNIIRLTLRKTKNPMLQVQECLVFYQTLEDSKRARSEILDEKIEEISKKKKEIFKDGHVIMNILLSKTKSKEIKDDKKQTQGIQNLGGKQFQQIPLGGIINMMPSKLPFLQLMRTFHKVAKNSSLNLMATQYVKNPLKNNKFKFQTPIKQEVNFWTYFEIFYNYTDVQNKMEEFLKIPNEFQRNILGMLIDPLQFEVCEILNLLEDSEDLQTYIDEGLKYIQEKTQE